MLLNIRYPSISLFSLQTKRNNMKKICKVINNKFSKSCKNVGFIANLSNTMDSFCRGGGGCGDMSSKTVVNPSLKDHLAAAKIQRAYRRYMYLRNIKTNWKLHLEPKSRNRTIQQQQHLQHISLLDCYGRLCSPVPHRSIRESSADNGVSVPVYLNVYDITPINYCLYWLGLGAHHSGVQVYEVEYAFGTDEYGRAGILKTDPKECEDFTFRKEILIGWTSLGAKDVKNVIEELEEHYQLKDYHLLHNNCNHFSTQVCIRLTGNPIPPWVNRLARIGSLFIKWSKRRVYKREKGRNNLDEKYVKNLSELRLKNSSPSFSMVTSEITNMGKSSR